MIHRWCGVEVGSSPVVHFPSRVSHRIHSIVVELKLVVEEEEVVRRCRVVEDEWRDASTIEGHIRRKCNFCQFRTTHCE